MAGGRHKPVQLGAADAEKKKKGRGNGSAAGGGEDRHRPTGRPSIGGGGWGRTVGDGTLTTPFAFFIRTTPVGRHGPSQATTATGRHEAAPKRRSKSARRLLPAQEPEIARRPEQDRAVPQAPEVLLTPSNL
jgi:hypothetical protein